MQVKISEIYISPNRQRQKISEASIAELAVSIQAQGLINPVALEQLDRVRFPDAPSNCQYRLLAGYRRLLAITLMKQPVVEATLREGLTDLQREEIELDENLIREDLHYTEEIAAKARIAEVRKQLYGDTIRDVAEHLGESRGETWEDIQLAKAIKLHPELADAKNKTAAQNKLRLMKRREALTAKAAELEEAAGNITTGYEDKVFLGDCTQVTADWLDGCCQLVLTDPPYGIDLDQGETKKGNMHPEVYDDDHYDIMDLTSRAAKIAYRLLGEHCHAYFWFDIKSYQKVLSILQAAGFTVDPIPLIWVKPGPGQVNHPDSRFGSGYETCFFCRKGSRALLKQGQSNVLLHDPVPSKKKIHPTEKPTSLLRQLIESSTAPGEVVVDLFGGSGSTAEAAIQLNRNFLLVEKDPAYYAGILERLQQLSKPMAKYDPLAGEEEEE